MTNLEELLKLKAKIDSQIVELSEKSENHFETDPDDITEIELEAVRNVEFHLREALDELEEVDCRLIRSERKSK